MNDVRCTCSICTCSANVFWGTGAEDDGDSDEDSLGACGTASNATPDAARAMPLRSPEGFMCEPATGPVASTGPGADAIAATHGALVAHAS